MGDKATATPTAQARTADWQRRVITPVNEVPVLLPWSGVLARSEDVAVVLVGASLYSSGIQFDLSVRGRGSAAIGIHEAALGRVKADGDVLCFGVEMADGQSVANILKDGAGPGLPESGPSLSAGGGGGSHGAVYTTYFLYPVPVAGPLSVLCAWPARGIDETRVVFDGTDLPRLLTRVEELWPYEAVTTWPPTPPKPNLPAGGWFEAYAAGPRA